jgi:hypothetical protein
MAAFSEARSSSGIEAAGNCASSEDLAVRSKPRQAQEIVFTFPVNEQEVRLYVAVAISLPSAAQRMVATARVERLIVRQGRQYAERIASKEAL